MKLSGWGNFPVIEGEVYSFSSECELKDIQQKITSTIPHGNGRSYGDSALAAKIINTQRYDFFKEFDSTTGVLKVCAGTLLKDIMEAFLSKGWWLPVTPGTRFVSVGGAIAADVHGKNHHLNGCFSEFLQSFTLCVTAGESLYCSRHENSDLFHATCGGLGLTGVILEATIQLVPVTSSQLQQQTYKTQSLEQTIQVLSDNLHSPYTVAWLDCLATGDSTGKGVVSVADFCTNNKFDISPLKAFSLPPGIPSFALNRLSMTCFNWLYYHKAREGRALVNADSFFYPLDAMTNWNSLYGKNGFMQYQFVIPNDKAALVLRHVLSQIAQNSTGVFLAVLKNFGAENDNWLSFPFEGISLALDLHHNKKNKQLLDELDDFVHKHGGRLYLVKDSRMQSKYLDASYPNLAQFRKLRAELGLSERFQSAQSMRLKL